MRPGYLLASMLGNITNITSDTPPVATQELTLSAQLHGTNRILQMLDDCKNLNHAIMDVPPDMPCSILEPMAEKHSAQCWAVLNRPGSIAVMKLAGWDQETVLKRPPEAMRCAIDE